MKARWLLLLQCGFAALGTCVAAQAQELRDPTQLPRLGPAAMPSAMTASEGLTVMVRNGKPHLVVGTRWYGVGESVGHLRIDRITETEVWLHDGNAVIKTPRFAGITRSASACASAAAPQGGASAAGAASDGTIQKKLLTPAPVSPTGEPAGPCEETTP